MSTAEIAVLAYIIGAFATFGVTLFCVAQWAGHADAAKHIRPQHGKRGASHYPTDAGLIVDD